MVRGRPLVGLRFADFHLNPKILSLHRSYANIGMYEHEGTDVARRFPLPRAFASRCLYWKSDLRDSCLSEKAKTGIVVKPSKRGPAELRVA